MMTTNRRLFLIACCAATAVAVAAVSWASREEPTMSSPSGYGAIEARIISVLEDMYQNQRKGMWNISREDGRLLRLLTEATNAKHVVEIGTSNGYSAIWFCMALSVTNGKLTQFLVD